MVITSCRSVPCWCTCMCTVDLHEITSYIASTHSSKLSKSPPIKSLPCLHLPVFLPSEVPVPLDIPCGPLVCALPSQPLFASLLCSKARGSGVGTASVPSLSGENLLWGSLTDVIPDEVEAPRLSHEKATATALCTTLRALETRVASSLSSC